VSLEDSLRIIVREELQLALQQLQPKSVAAHVSSSELMELLSISRGTLRKMMAEGLPYTSPGKYPRFSVSAVEQWLQERRDGGR
jgi:excisionase family DNA binding protein